MMKHFATGLILFCLSNPILCLGQQLSAYFNEKDSVTISGKIIGFKPGAGDDFISFLTVDISGNSKKHSFQIQPDGSFHVAIYQHFVGDITMNYRTAFTSILTCPGSNLYIQIHNKAIEAGKQVNEVFLANGDLADINNLLFDFRSKIRNHTFIQQVDIGNKQQSDSTFSVLRLKKLQEELALLDSFIQDGKVNDTQFKDWQKNQLVYEAGKEILLFPFLGKVNKTISDRQLLDLIHSIPVNNPSALKNSAYYDFLNMLAGGLQIIVNINPVYEPIKKANGNSAVAVNLDQFDKLASGISREILYFDLYLSHFQSPSRKNITGTGSERFESVVLDPCLKKMLKILVDSAEQDFKPYHVISRITELKASIELKARLLAVFEKAAGSNIFIDFWGDWCGPCMMEMPAYPKLIAKFQNKPIKFIFFSAHTTDKSVQRVKEKYQINADFINLTNDEVAIMNNVFGFHSYPAHFLINSQGYVVGEHTKREEEIERLLFK